MRITEQRNRLDQFTPDVLIRPELPKDVNAIVGYGRVKELITIGEQAAEDHIVEIKTLLQTKLYWPFSLKTIEIKKKNY